MGFLSRWTRAFPSQPCKAHKIDIWSCSTPLPMDRRPCRSGALAAIIDTNVLLYAEANDVPEKQRGALSILKQLYEGANGVLSTQVLQEYCNVALKKLRLPLQHVRAQLDLYEQFEVVQVTSAIIRAGLD